MVHLFYEYILCLIKSQRLLQIIPLGVLIVQYYDYYFNCDLRQNVLFGPSIFSRINMGTRVTRGKLPTEKKNPRMEHSENVTK